MVRKI